MGILGFCLLVLALIDKVIPSLALIRVFLRILAYIKDQLTHPGFVIEQLGFLDFPLVDSHCWTSWTTASEPL